MATEVKNGKEQIVGGILSCQSGDKGVIVMVNLLPEFRGNGFGKKLLHANLKAMFDLGIS